MAAERVNPWEATRGNMASFLLIGFGLADMVRGIKNHGKKHSHALEHASDIIAATGIEIRVLGI